MFLLLCAMKEEVSDIIAKSGITGTYDFFNMKFYTGKIAGRDVAAGMTGVGKVMAASVTQKLIDKFNPEGIIFSGIAGAVNRSLDIGDMVISRDCLQHDFNATALGFRPGEIPYTGIRFIDADRKLLDAASGFDIPGKKVLEGRILTGDQFISTASAEIRAFLSEELGGDAVEMEGAAAAFAARMNNVPFVIARIISDRADGNAPADFRNFLKKSSAVLADLVEHILERL